MAIKSRSQDEENVSSVFSQWVADNCHHNVNTQDEKGVFYLMGIIECTISQGEFQDKPIKRIKHLLKKEAKLRNKTESKLIGTISLHACSFKSHLKPISFITKELPDQVYPSPIRHGKTALLKLVEKGYFEVMKICSTFNNTAVQLAVNSYENY